jgi:hypothetical protein
VTIKSGVDVRKRLRLASSGYLNLCIQRDGLKANGALCLIHLKRSSSPGSESNRQTSATPLKLRLQGSANVVS